MYIETGLLAESLKIEARPNLIFKLLTNCLKCVLGVSERQRFHAGRSRRLTALYSEETEISEARVLIIVIENGTTTHTYRVFYLSRWEHGVFANCRMPLRGR